MIEFFAEAARQHPTHDPLTAEVNGHVAIIAVATAGGVAFGT
jgi:hypothetical protein